MSEAAARIVCRCLMVAAIAISVGALPAGAQAVLSHGIKLTPRIDLPGVGFGRSVATSGDTLVIGAPGDPLFGTSAGAAFVFSRSGSHWIMEARLDPGDPEPFDLFGHAVAISGNTILVGAFRDDDGADDAGSAYVFVRVGQTWTQQAKLLASDPGASDSFGRALAIDGDTAIVGSPTDNAGGTNTGSAYVFTRTGSSWTQQAKLLEAGMSSGHRFGVSVAISGETAVVGNRLVLFPSFGPGRAFVFARSGAAWTLQTTLQPHPSALPGQPLGFIGVQVAILDDTIVMGVPENVLPSAISAGEVRVFVRSGTSWSLQALFLSRDIQFNSRFGSSVAIDGSMVAVGATQSWAAGVGSGVAHVYRREGAEWQHIAQLEPSDLAAQDGLGNAIAVSGSSVLVGAELHDNAAVDSGAVYGFELD